MKTLINLSIVVMLSALAAGCISVHQMQNPYNDADFTPFDASGTATITGQAFLKTVGGEVRYAAGNTVTLIPNTPYSTEAVMALKSLQQPQVDPRMQGHCRKTVADGSGNFEFDKVPAGAYFIQCPIFWGVPNEYGGIDQTGGLVFGEAVVNDGQTVRVIVTQ